MRRLRGLLANLLVLAISLGVALVAAEIVLRFVYTPPFLNRRVTEFDPLFGWKLVPGRYEISGKESESPSGHVIEVNRLGMRNPEIPLRPEENTKRVLLLGDSFTFGMFIPGEDLMAAVAEQTLHDGGLRDVEVVNAGAQGYGTAAQLLYHRWLTEEGFRTDVFVLAFFLNDVLDNMRLDYVTLEPQPMSPGFRLTEDGGVVLDHRPLAPPKPHPVPEEEAIADAPQPRWRYRPLLPVFVRNRAIAFLETRAGMVRFLQRLGVEARLPRLPSFVQGWYEESLTEPGWPLTQALVRQLREEVESTGARFALLVIPSPFQVYESYDVLVRNNFPDDPLARRYLEDPLLPQRTMREFCREEDIPFLDLQESFEPEREGASLYSPKDHHLSTRGHRVAGRALAEFVETVLERSAP